MDTLCGAYYTDILFDMTILVIDMEHFKDKDGNFLPKEVVIGTIDKPHEMVFHTVVAPPYAASKLPRRIHRENKWKTENHHGIHWSDGDTTDLDFLRATLWEIANSLDGTVLYTRGSETTKFLEDVTDCKVINLSNHEDFPASADPSPSSILCPWHGRNNSTNIVYHCALENVKRMQIYIMLSLKKNCTLF